MARPHYAVNANRSVTNEMLVGHRPRPHHRRAGVGILIRKEFRELGYASEALDLLIRYAFDVLSLRQLFSNMTPENTASVSLFEKFGFTRCGIKKDWVRIGDGWTEEWMYQLIRQAKQD